MVCFSDGYNGLKCMPKCLAARYWVASLRIGTFIDEVLYDLHSCLLLPFKAGIKFLLCQFKNTLTWLYVLCTMYTVPMPKFYIWLVEAQNLGVILKICLWSWVEQLLFPKGAICQKIKAYIIWVVCVCIIVQVYFFNQSLTPITKNYPSLYQ